MYQVQLAEAGFNCLQEIESFHIERSRDTAAAAAFTDRLLDEIESSLSENPLLYRQSLELANYGIDCRERIDALGYRTLYSVNGNRVEVLLILHQHQSIQHALYRHSLVYR